MAVLKIPVTKAARTIDVDTDSLPEEVYAAAMAEGLKVLLNAKMSKIAVKDLEGEHLAAAREAAMRKAEENLAALYAGKIKTTRTATAKDASGSKVSGPVLVEARRLAKAKVKDLMREAGIKISHVEAKQITAAANELLAQDPSFIEQAKINLEARATQPVAIDIASLIHESPKLVAKATEKKAKDKETRVLSAKQASKVAPHVPAKGAVPPAHATTH